MLHNKDKIRLFNKYAKKFLKEKESAKSLINLINVRNITPKRIKAKAGYWFVGLSFANMLEDYVNREGFMRRLLRRAELEDRQKEACSDLAKRTSLEWFFFISEDRENDTI